jgi:hypothetical protein
MTEFSNPVAQQTLEQQNLLQSVHQAGSNLLTVVAQGFHENRKKALALLAVGSAALGGGLGMDLLTPNMAAAGAKKATACENVVPGAVSVSYVDEAALPLASKVISAYHDAERSEIGVKKNQAEINGRTYSHLTEVDITVPVNTGVYNYTAQFSGGITSKDLVAVELDSYKYRQIGVARVEENVYDFYIEKTDGDFEDPHQGLQWDMLHAYSDGSNTGDLVISKLANGSELPGYYIMTAPIFSVGISQAEGVLEGMVEHKDVTQQNNLNASEMSENHRTRFIAREACA